MEGVSHVSQILKRFLEKKGRIGVTVDDAYIHVSSVMSFNNCNKAQVARYMTQLATKKSKKRPIPFAERIPGTSPARYRIRESGHGNYEAVKCSEIQSLLPPLNPNSRFWQDRRDAFALKRACMRQG